MGRRKKIKSWKQNWYYVCRGCHRREKHITRHHLVPRGSDAFKEHLEKHKNARCISLCRKCHDFVHENFGEGHNFTGPTTKRHLIKWLQLFLKSEIAKRGYLNVKELV